MHGNKDAVLLEGGREAEGGNLAGGDVLDAEGDRVRGEDHVGLVESGGVPAPGISVGSVINEVWVCPLSAGREALRNIGREGVLGPAIGVSVVGILFGEVEEISGVAEADVSAQIGPVQGIDAVIGEPHSSSRIEGNAERVPNAGSKGSAGGVVIASIRDAAEIVAAGRDDSEAGVLQNVLISGNDDVKNAVVHGHSIAVLECSSVGKVLDHCGGGSQVGCASGCVGPSVNNGRGRGIDKTTVIEKAVAEGISS